LRLLPLCALLLLLLLRPAQLQGLGALLLLLPLLLPRAWPPLYAPFEPMCWTCSGCIGTAKCLSACVPCEQVEACNQRI
jgi:hypothetical protein